MLEGTAQDIADPTQPGTAGTRRIRIAVVVSFWSLGGASAAAARIGSALQQRGHDVEIWYLYRKTDHALPAGPCSILIDKDLSRSLGYFRLPGLLLSRIRRFRPDTVISFSPLAHLLGQVLALVSGVRERVASHRVVCDQYSPALRLLDMVYGSIGGYTAIVAVSDAVRQSVASYPRSYRRLVRVIHNGVERVPSSIGRQEARDSFRLPQDAPLILAVGRLADQKNYPLLIEAVSRVPQAHLVVAGSGPLKRQLEAQAASLGMSDRLHLLGHLSHQALSDLFRACDVFALASIFEGQSNALLEAMAEGLPIIASDIPEQIETLRDAEGRDAGQLLPVNDVGAWTDAIRRLAGDPALCASLGAAARERARHFTIDRMVDAFEDVARGDKGVNA